MMPMPFRTTPVMILSSLLCVVLLLNLQDGHAFCPKVERTHQASTRRMSTTPKSSVVPPGTVKGPQKETKRPPSFVQGPDKETKPDYENIHGPLGKLLDRIFLVVFRSKLAENVGVDSSLPKGDYQGLMELSNAMNARYSDRTEIQKIAQETLRDLFPSWLPGQYAILFSRPFPEFSARMNAWATRVGGTWLMGECEVNDVEIDGKVYKEQGLLVKRCRFLEESGCASVCVNACKIPTQNFFQEDMGIPLTMTPDYETHECQFTFGQMPNAEEEAEAKNTPCLSRCPSAGGMRKWHDGSISAPPEIKRTQPSACDYMDEAQ